MTASGIPDPTDQNLGGAEVDPAVADELAQVQNELASLAASVVVTNHAIGLFQLATIHLNQRPPQLNEAQVAIDALAGMLDGVEGRLGDDEPTLRDALAQLRLAFVQLAAPMADQEPELSDS